MKTRNISRVWKLILYLPLFVLLAQPAGEFFFEWTVLLLIPIIVLYFFAYRIQAPVHQVEILGKVYELTNFWETAALFVITQGVILNAVRVNHLDYSLLGYALLLFAYALSHFRIRRIR